MKKLVFAAMAMVAMVSVSNVFASGSHTSLGAAVPEDTTTTDTVAPAEPAAPAEDVAPADTAAETAMLFFSDTTNVSTDTTKAEPVTTDSTSVA